MIYSFAVKAENSKSEATETKISWLQEVFVVMLTTEITFTGDGSGRAGKYESANLLKVATGENWFGNEVKMTDGTGATGNPQTDWINQMNRELCGVERSLEG